MAEADHHEAGGGEDVEPLAAGAGGEPEVVREVGGLDDAVRRARALDAEWRRARGLGGVEPETQAISRIRGAPSAALGEGVGREELTTVPAAPVEEKEADLSPGAGCQRRAARQARDSRAVPLPGADLGA
jgi:hypothetical protein